MIFITPKTIGLFYFSGTGNPKLVSNLLDNEFNSSQINVDVIAIDDILRKKKKFNSSLINTYDLIGIGYPVHAFNAPKIVFDFIKGLPILNKKKSFLFKTSGDPLCKGGSTSMIKKQLKKKGLFVFHESLIVMPSNIAIKYDDELIKQLYAVAVRKIKIIAQQILKGSKNLQRNGLILNLISIIFSRMESIGAKYFGKYLSTTEACNLCQICVKSCPTGNIKIKEKELLFDNKCGFCLRCVYICPQKALSNRYLDFMIIKDGYDISKVIDDPNIKANYLSRDTKGYFKHFYKNLTHL